MDGRPAGELGLNGLVAAHFGVPVALVTGDTATADDARALIPEIEAVVVKESITRFAAQSLHPHVARDLIREGARRAVGALAQRHLLPRYDDPATIEVTFLTADMAGACTAIRGVELVASQPRTVRCVGTDHLALFRAFVAMTLITRSLVE